MKIDPIVTVIAVNYRQPAATCDLLRSLRQHDYSNLEVIVVENSRTEDANDRYEAAYPGVKVIVSDKNAGYAGGNNLGLKAAAGEYLFIINNDTELLPGTIQSLVDAFSDPAVGMACPKIKYYDHPEMIQFAGFSEVDMLGRNKMIGKHEVDHGQHDLPSDLPYGHGAAMMISRSALETVGPMPEDFFLYYEELDWSARFTKKGFRIRYIPDAVVLHKESASVGKGSPMRTYYMTRNRVWFMKRQAPFFSRLVFYLYFYFVAFPKNLFQRVARGQWDQASSILKGAWHALF